MGFRAPLGPLSDIPPFSAVSRDRHRTVRRTPSSSLTDIEDRARSIDRGRDNAMVYMPGSTAGSLANRRRFSSRVAESRENFHPAESRRLGYRAAPSIMAGLRYKRDHSIDRKSMGEFLASPYASRKATKSFANRQRIRRQLLSDKFFPPRLFRVPSRRLFCLCVFCGRVFLKNSRFWPLFVKSL